MSKIINVSEEVLREVIIQKLNSIKPICGEEEFNSLADSILSDERVKSEAVKFHEEEEIERNHCYRMRVIGGFIYSYYSVSSDSVTSSVFVPQPPTVSEKEGGES